MEYEIDSNPLSLRENQVFIVAEAACNHMCDIELAKVMIDEAAEAGADSIKFQTYKSERMVTKNAKAYWGSETMSQQQYYKRLDRFEKEDYGKLFEYCKSKEIIGFSTPFSIEDAVILNELDMQLFKIPSFEIIDLELLECIAKFGKPIILSTGASTFEEIDNAVSTITRFNPKLALMACTLSYPTDYEDANLMRIKTLKKRYPKIMIGISDHTPPEENMAIPAFSVGLGARIIEKHYTLSQKLTGSGHFFSLEPKDLKKMVTNVRLFEKTIGDGFQGLSPSEIKATESGRKSIVASRKILTNQVISRDDLAFKRPGNGISPNKLSDIVGKKANADFEEDDQITIRNIK